MNGQQRYELACKKYNPIVTPAWTELSVWDRGCWERYADKLTADITAAKILLKEHGYVVAPEVGLDTMVNRFLAWPLPESVYPDAGKFDANNNRWRSGTNLLTATEAREMLKHILAVP